jgi:hypothetical protein
VEFKCVTDCSQCCIEREYYPTKKFGKIGVLILPEEKEKIEQLVRIDHPMVDFLVKYTASVLLPA